MKIAKKNVHLAELHRKVEKLGGVEAFRSGEWVPRLVAQTFRAYYENATPGYFREKYPDLSHEEIYAKLKRAGVRQAGLVGAATGLAMSANELTALATGGELFVGLSGNVLLAAITIASDLVGAMAIQLRLVVQIARPYGVELDLDDPEDVWVVFGFAIGGEISQELSRAGAKLGGRLARRAIRKQLSGELLETAKQLAAKVGVKLLQNTVIGLAVPGVSIAIATYLNRRFTSKVAEVAQAHFQGLAKERGIVFSGLGNSTPRGSRNKSGLRRAFDEFIPEPPTCRYLWHLLRSDDWEFKLKTFLGGGLWLARLDTFEDPLEGTMPDHNLGLMEKLLGSSILAEKVAKECRIAAQNAYASCWHMSDGSPSEYAWKEFGDEHAGIALKTTRHKLRKQLGKLLGNDGPGYLSEITYIDHTCDVIPEAQTLEACFVVQDNYAAENEARILVSAHGTAAFDRLRLLENMWGTPLVEELRVDSRMALKGSIPSQAGKIHDKDGQAMVPRISFNKLVDEIVVGYNMDPAEKEKLESMLCAGGFRGKLRSESR